MSWPSVEITWQKEVNTALQWTPWDHMTHMITNILLSFSCAGHAGSCDDKRWTYLRQKIYRGVAADQRYFSEHRLERVGSLWNLRKSRSVEAVPSWCTTVDSSCGSLQHITTPAYRIFGGRWWSSLSRKIERTERTLHRFRLGLCSSKCGNADS